MRKNITLIAAIMFPELKLDENNGSNEHPLLLFAKERPAVSLISGTEKPNPLKILFLDLKFFDSSVFKGINKPPKYLVVVSDC